MKLRIPIPELGKNKRRLEIVLLAIIVAVLVGMALDHFYYSVRYYQRPVICKSCGFREVLTLSGKQPVMKCPKCGGPFGFAYKCVECDYEFPVVPRQTKPGEVKSKAEMIQFEIDRGRCVNCHSESTYLVPLKDFDTKN